MKPPDYDDLLTVLDRVSDEDRVGLSTLMPTVYQELRTLAERNMRGQRDGHTLQATALTHEVYLRLRNGATGRWKNRGHFLAVAARAMRQILVDHERRRRASKRGGDQQRVPLDDVPLVPGPSELDLVALDGALDALAKAEPRKAHVVELLYFGGLTAVEAAEFLGVTSRTVERDWQHARVWLLRQMS